MRDYKFGNYITALRRKCGYTIVEYESGVKRRIFSVLLFIVFGVLGYFLIKS